MSYRDHAFVTFSRTDFTREKVRDILVAVGAVGGIVVIEPHADKVCDDCGSTKSCDRCVADALLSSDHVHAAVYGSFRQDRMAKTLHREYEGRHIRIDFQHPPREGAKKGAPWPFYDMVTYVVDPEKDKVVDSTPLYFTTVADDDDPTCLVELVNQYDRYKDADKQMLPRLKKMKTERASTASAIETMDAHLDKHNAFRYRVWKDYWDNLEPTPPVSLLSGQTPRQWQQKLIDFVRQPVTADTNSRGAWVHLPPDSGKSWALEFISIAVGADNVFTPGIRPSGSYDLVSLRTYAGQQVLWFDDVSPLSAVRSNEDGEADTHYKWSPSFLDMLKRMADITPFGVEFGGRYTLIHIRGRVLVCSNFALPEGRSDDETVAIARRYVYIRVVDDMPV